MMNRHSTERHDMEEEMQAFEVEDDGPSDSKNAATSSDATTSEKATVLDERIIGIVKSCPNYKVRPARVASELGMSLNDASAELCTLLAAVGGGHDGASFTFEALEAVTGAEKKTMSMVFQFPPDFERRARRRRREKDVYEKVQQALTVAWKLLKIITAFGLFLSLAILVIAALVGMMAALIALSSQNNNNNHHRHLLLRQVHTLFYSVRQFLWFYALFGPSDTGEDDNNNQDPFFREMAYDIALWSSVCCGNPGSLFWWFRLEQLQQRRQRRGWRGFFRNSNNTAAGEVAASDVEGVQFIRQRRRTDWSDTLASPPSHEEMMTPHRGMLSVAVEYLFGPSASPGPTEIQKWKQRGAALMQLSNNNSASGVALEELVAYTDDPPSSLQDSSKIVSQVLPIISHFNGVPAAVVGANDFDSEQKARFFFPELMAESSYATMFLQEDDYSTAKNTKSHYYNHDTVLSWESLLYDNVAAAAAAAATSSTETSRRSAKQQPNYYKEHFYRWTQLPLDQLAYCIFLGFLNFIGVLSLRASVGPGGLLEIHPEQAFLYTVIVRGLVRILFFYAILFFCLPAARLLIILLWNKQRQRRNQQRMALAKALLQ